MVHISTTSDINLRTVNILYYICVYMYIVTPSNNSFQLMLFCFKIRWEIKLFVFVFVFVFVFIFTYYVCHINILQWVIFGNNQFCYVKTHISHTQSFNIPVSIRLTTLADILNYSIFNMQYFKCRLCISILLDCLGHVVSPLWCSP